MIRYALKCKEGHSFDSWFQSAQAFDTLVARGMVACAVCGISDVEKAIMAPRVSTKDMASSEEPEARPLSTPAHPTEQALASMREALEKNADFVGDQFATEARAIHVGDAPDRMIWGQANAKEAKELVEEGVPVVPLPVTPPRKVN